MSCGIIMWENTAGTKKGILYSKKIIRTIAGTERRVSFRET
jgi:hypothetical protein